MFDRESELFYNIIQFHQINKITYNGRVTNHNNNNNNNRVIDKL